MEGANTTKETIISTVVALIGIAAESEYRERVLGVKVSEDRESDAVEGDGVLEQLNQQIAELKTHMNLETAKRASLVGKLAEFREKLKIRHTRIPDNVLQKYDEFFELKDV